METLSKYRERKVYVLSVLLAAVITAGGNILAENWGRLFPPKSPSKVQVESTSQTESDLAPGKRSTSPPDVEWRILEPNVVYRAESHGFVAARSGGNGRVMAGLIREGPDPSNLDTRTRFQAYDGAVLPVLEGRYWMVQAYREGDVNSISVQWLPTP